MDGENTVCRNHPKFASIIASLAEIVFLLTRYMVIRSLIAALGIVITANLPANAAAQRLFLWTLHPMRVALPDFAATAPSEVDPARAISRIIATDLLKLRDKFTSVDPTAYAEKKANIDDVPDFKDWRAIDAQALVVGRVTRQPDARIRVEFRLWDAFVEKQLVGRVYIGSPDDLDGIAHVISQDIYRRITGEKRTFD